MKYTKIIKPLTLLLFFCLISIFIIYRTGGLNKYILKQETAIQTSPNGGTISTTQKDSLKLEAIDSVYRRMMYSSKSGKIVETFKFKSDSIRKVIKRKFPGGMDTTKRLMMSSSKVLILVDEQTTLFDTIQKKNKNNPFASKDSTLRLYPLKRDSTKIQNLKQKKS